MDYKAETREHIDLLLQACCGNKEAFKFLVGAHKLIHYVDDIIDEKLLGIVPETFILAKNLYSCEFYIANQSALSIVLDLVSNSYQDSEIFNKEEFGSWKRTVGNIIRSQCVDVTLAVACLCGGYSHMRSISIAVRELSWKHQNKN